MTWQRCNNYSEKFDSEGAHKELTWEDHNQDHIVPVMPIDQSLLK